MGLVSSSPEPCREGGIEIHGSQCEQIVMEQSLRGLSWWLSGKESTWQCRRCEFNPWVRKSPWRRSWQPTPVFLPGKSHGQRCLAGYSPWGCKRIGHGLVTKQQSSILLYFYILLVTQFCTTEKYAFYTESATKTLALLGKNKRISLQHRVGKYFFFFFHLFLLVGG